MNAPVRLLLLGERIANPEISKKCTKTNEVRMCAQADAPFPKSTLHCWIASNSVLAHNMQVTINKLFNKQIISIYKQNLQSLLHRQ